MYYFINKFLQATLWGSSAHQIDEELKIEQPPIIPNEELALQNGKTIA